MAFPYLNSITGKRHWSYPTAKKKPVVSTPSAPAVPKTPTPYVTPGPDQSWQDQQYFDTDAGIGQRLGNLQGYLINAGQATGADYGINYDGDPVNGATNFRIDPNVDVTNPFSRAALLKKAYQQATAGNTNSMAAHGQLYSGALQRAQNETGRQNLQAQDSLIKDFAGRFGGLYQNWLSGQGQATTDRVDAQLAAQGRHENDPVITGGTKQIPMSQATARGLTFSTVGGKIVVKDSQGNVIPGARVVIAGKRHYVRVPA